MSLKNKLKSIISETLKKFEDGLIQREYEEVEQVPPAPGQSWEQHDTMVNRGLCKKACQNERKNRYCNLFPFDETIVNLEDPNQYVNASWVRLLPWHPNKRFIATMGPMHPKSYSSSMKSDFDETCPENTCPDFWQMIWDTKAKLIVMLCEVTPGFTGCSQYFPLNRGDEVKFGHFTIKNVDTKETIDDGDTKPTVIERTFDLASSKNSSEEQRKIQHFQFLKWPNYGVPDAVGPISDFVKKVHETAKELNNDPEFVVHCSGGIGRSGTFLTSYGVYTHYLYAKEISEEKPLSLVETVKNLRFQRHPWMVEGNRQYEMAYYISLFLMKEVAKNLPE